MRRILVSILFLIVLRFDAGAKVPLNYSPDTLDNQVLYNGRLWRNLYSRVRGNPFLFTDEFLEGTVTIGDKTFKNVSLKYDIYDDEVISLSDKGFIIKLNKEMVDAFSYKWHDREYRFVKTGSDTLKNPDGYVNVLSEGKVILLVKYKKEILLLAVDNKYDQFDQMHRIYLKRDGETFFVNNKRELLLLLNDSKQEIKSFISGNNIKVTKNNPDSFRSVVDFYNDIHKN